MAYAELEEGQDQETKDLAQAIIDAQAKEIALEVEKQGGPKGLEEKEVIALIAYLQRLGTDIKAAPPPPADDKAPNTAAAGAPDNTLTSTQGAK